MTAGPYRDALAAVRERVQTLDAEVERLSSRVSPLDLALCPEEVALRVDELRAATASAPEPTLAAWAEREQALEALVTALGRADALAPALEVRAQAPLPPESGDPRPFLMDELRHQRMRRQVEAELSTRTRVEQCTRWSDQAYLWKFELDRVPFSLHGAALLGSLVEEIEVELTLRTAVPTELGCLRVAPAHWWDRASVAPEPNFARHFSVWGPARLAGALLGDELRAQLSSLHPHGARLEIADGVATLAWSFRDIAYDEPSLGVLSAVRALVALRRALD